jgi:2,3-bisphosphoglycerate-dependent phosphoglycerate mutase
VSASLAVGADALQRTTRIVAVRHGETAWNVDTRIQGQLNIGLNGKGRWQAARLAEALVGEGLSAVYSSDLMRAADTAMEVGLACGLPVGLEPGLRERCFGVFEGRTWAEIEKLWPAESACWRARDLDFAPIGGESLPAFSSRVMATCHRLASIHPGECIAWVAHGGVMDCLHRAATHVGLAAPRTWQLANATVNRLLFTGEGFTLVGWGDASHLADSIASTARDDVSVGVRQVPGSADGVGHAA